jgi:hypothetical protein
VADIVDNDTLSNVQNNANGTYNAYAYADDADADDNDFEGDAGNNSTASNIADASASVSGSAFNMEVVLGANLQQNAVDATVVGGNNHMNNDASSDDA